MQAIAALKGEKGISAWVDWGKKKQNNCLILEWRHDCDYQLEKPRAGYKRPEDLFLL